MAPGEDELFKSTPTKEDAKKSDLTKDNGPTASRGADIKLDADNFPLPPPVPRSLARGMVGAARGAAGITVSAPTASPPAAELPHFGSTLAKIDEDSDADPEKTAPGSASTPGEPSKFKGANLAGMSQLRFMNLMAANKGTAVNPRPISREEVAKHCTANDAWTILNGDVYNLTPYMDFHPGGKDILTKLAAGKDCTEGFKKFHPWVNYQELLSGLYLGPAETLRATHLSP